MSELEEKLNAVVSNPQLMQQIAAMAQSLGNSNSSQPEQDTPAPGPSLPNLDPAMVQRLLGLVNHGRTDNDQQMLLQALSPYLSRQRLTKLERAMQASRLAGAASAFLNAGGLQMLKGR